MNAKSLFNPIPLFLIGALAWWPMTGALAAVPDDLGGRIEAQVNGKPITLPLLKTDIDADVQGDLPATEPAVAPHGG